MPQRNLSIDEPSIFPPVSNLLPFHPHNSQTPFIQLTHSLQFTSLKNLTLLQASINFEIHRHRHTETHTQTHTHEHTPAQIWQPFQKKPPRVLHSPVIRAPMLKAEASYGGVRCAEVKGMWKMRLWGRRLVTLRYGAIGNKAIYDHSTLLLSSSILKARAMWKTSKNWNHGSTMIHITCRTAWWYLNALKPKCPNASVL
jgi:hypothetical protein